MKIIITGGTGLIGRELCKQLVKDGHTVYVLSRNPDTVKGLPAGTTAVKWDAASAAGWGHLAEGADAIVNLAGEGIGDGRWSDKRKRAIRESRIDAGRAVMAAIDAATVKPNVLVQASAVGYYGPRRDEIITEESAPGSDFLPIICFDWEASTAGAARLGVRRPVLRTGIVLSSAGGALPKLLLPFKLFAGGPLGNGRQWLPWIHMQDTVRAIQFLIEHESASGPFNLTAPEPLTNKEFGKVLAAVMGRPSFMPAPGFAIKAVLGDMATMVLDGQRAMPRRLQELGFTFSFPDAESALKDVLGK